MVIYRPGKVSYSSLGVTLQSISGVVGQVRRFLFNGSQFVIVEFDTAAYTTELNYWDTDGSPAVSRILSKTKVLDVTYDKGDSRYYAIRWNMDSGFTGSPSTDFPAGVIFYDDFSVGGTSSAAEFRGDYWIEQAPTHGGYSRYSEDSAGTTYVSDTKSWTLFYRSISNNRLEYTTRYGRGLLRTAAAMSGDFQARATVKMSKMPGATSTFSMRMIDISETFTGVQNNNLVAQVTMWGPYDSSSLSLSNGRWQSAHTYLTRINTSNLWTVTNFRLLDPLIDSSRGMLTTNSGSGNYSDYDVLFYDRRLVGGSYIHYFKVNQTAPGSVILASGTISNAKKASNLVDGPFAFTLQGNPAVNFNSYNLVGTSLQFKVSVDGPLVGDMSLAAVSGTSGFYIGVGRTGTNLYARRDTDGSVTGSSWQDVRVYNLIPPTATPSIAVELCGDCTSAAVGLAPDISVDDFTIESTTGSTVWSDIPSFSIETYDTTGAVYPIAGVTDGDGYAIRRLNILNCTTSGGGAAFSNVLSNSTVAITSDHLTAAQNGCLYVLYQKSSADVAKVYRFKKSSFPLTSLESGQNASLVASGVLDYPTLYKLGSFSYNGYSGGQLSYATDNWADPTMGMYLGTLLSGTCSGTVPRRTSWLQRGVDYIGWNINDFNSLYGVTVTGTSAGQVQLFNMTPTTAAFCNVVSNYRMLAAGTNDTSVVEAQVMNTYGDPLENKTVAFSVTAGDGSLSPASATTNASGVAISTYTVGTAITTSTITATVNI